MSLPAAGQAPRRGLLLVRSSLQFLLGCALACHWRDTHGTRTRLLFVPEVQDPSLFMRAAECWAASPLESVALLASRKLPGDAAPKRGWAEVRDGIVASMAAWPADVIGVFNDREEAGQCVLTTAATRLPAATRVCIEDGSLAYSSHRYRRNSWWTRTRARLRHGPGWADVSVLGTHPLVHRFVALRPDLLREELRARAVEPLPLAALSSPAMRELSDALCRLAGMDARTIPPQVAMLMVSHPDYAARNPGYMPLMQACVDRLRREGRRCLVKYHPRDTSPDALGVGRANEVPRTLPVEALFLRLQGCEAAVIGGASTALLSAALMLPRARCAVVMPAGQPGGGDQWSPALRASLGITALSDEGQLDEVLGPAASGAGGDQADVAVQTRR